MVACNTNHTTWSTPLMGGDQKKKTADMILDHNDVLILHKNLICNLFMPDIQFYFLPTVFVCENCVRWRSQDNVFMFY